MVSPRKTIRRRKKEEGRRKKEEGRRNYELLVMKLIFDSKLRTQNFSLLNYFESYQFPLHRNDIEDTAVPFPYLD
ncbi:hypothetical protein [Phormidium nigroviride]